MFSSDNKIFYDDMEFGQIYCVFDFNLYMYISIDVGLFYLNNMVNIFIYFFYGNFQCIQFGFEGFDFLKLGLIL